MASIISRSILLRRARIYLSSLLLTLCLSGNVLAQSEKTAARPDRGTMPNVSYSVSDIENISLQNGNVNLSIPLASLPPIAGGKLSWTISAIYNSKIWNIIRRQEVGDSPVGGGNDVSLWRSYVVDTPQLNDYPGWRISDQYQVTIRNAHDDFDYEIPPDGVIPHYDYQLINDYQWYKVVLTMPDGSEHELRPIDYSPYPGGQSFLKGYYKETPSQSNPMRYYSFDGSFLYATIATDNNWTVYMPDGMKIIQTTDGIQRIQDTNGNKIKIYSEVGGGGTVTTTHYQDEQTGREIKYIDDRTANNGKGQGQVGYQTVGGEWKYIKINFDVTHVQGQIYKVNDWIPGQASPNPCQRYEHLDETILVIKEIVLPLTELGQSQRRFTFKYNSDTTETVTTPLVKFTCTDSPQAYTRTRSKGWGSLSEVKTPSGATITYAYSLDMSPLPTLTDNIAEESITKKQLTHDGITDIWTYSVLHDTATVTNPDTSTVTVKKYTHSPGFSYAIGKAGLVYSSTQPFSKVERHWTDMQFSGANGDSPAGPVSFNPVVDVEYTTLLDASNNALKMSAKAFQYDYNGNLIQTTEYDWFDPASVSRDAQDVPTGVPASATVLRVSNNSYYHPATSASSVNVYAKRSLSTAIPLILNAPQQTTVGASIAQFAYDGQSYGTAPSIGNVTNVSTLDNRGDTNPANDVWVSTGSTYGAYGNVATMADARGKVTQIFYEDATHAMPTRVVVDPQNGTGQQTSLTSYDYSTGAVLSQTDPNGSVSTIDYTNPLLMGAVDPFGRPGATYSPVVLVNGTSQRRKTATIYEDHLRKVTGSSDLNVEGDGLLKSETYADELGRVIETRQYETGTGYIANKQTYDSMGRVSQASNPYHASETVLWTTTTYDALGRVLTVKTPDNAVVSTTYAGNQVTVTDQAGKQRKSVTDALGRLIEVIEDPAGLAYQTTYTYDMLGNLRQVNQGTQTRTFTYSSLSRLTTATNPESGTISYQYDNNGNLTQKVDARGVKTTYSYDALNRVTSRTYSDGTPTVTYTYDTLVNGKGRLTSVSSSVSAYNYAGYDAMGRVKQSSQIIDGQTYTMSYGYNLAGAITSETYPSGRVVTTAYDNAGRLSSVSGQKTGENIKPYASTFSYSAHGAVTEVKLGNNLWEHTVFNNRLQPVLIGLGTSQSIPTAQDFNRFRVDYSYGTTNNNGNVLQQTISVPDTAGNYVAQMSQVYTYDELNRLKSAQENGGASWKQTYQYDRYGNRTFNADPSKTTANALGSVLTIDPNNNQFTANQGYIQYDKAGNLTREFNGHTFAYDGENKQVSYDGGATAGGTDYRYDGDGRRVKKVSGTGQATTLFIYNAMGQMVAEYTNTAQEIGSGGTSYLTSDMLGTPRVITGAEGTVKARHDYLPFGEEIAYNVGGRSEVQKYIYGTGNPDNVRQKFATYERDIETGLDYTWARHYSSQNGRFQSPDPYWKSADASIPQSWNRYTYCLNRPFTYVDPLGLTWLRYGNDGPVYYVDDKVYEKNKDNFKDFNVIPNGEVMQFNKIYVEKYKNLEGEWVQLNADGSISRVDIQEAVEVRDNGGSTIDFSPNNYLTELALRCERVANIGGSLNRDILGLKHWWLKTPETEAGAGPAGGGVPGHGGKDSPYVSQMTINDHSGEARWPESSCYPLPGLDVNIINSKLQIGRPLGRFSLWNNCQSNVISIMREADTVPDPIFMQGP